MEASPGSPSPFPKYLVGLLQSESEMLQAPEYDLLPALELDEDWDVEIYTERTVHALLESAERFDCIIVGYNAAYKSPEIRAGLAGRPPPVGMLVLHQLKPDALGFLDGDEPLKAAELPGRAAGARPVPDADAHDEILLNWPARVVLDHGVVPDSGAYLGITPAPESRWRSVLEVDSGGRHTPVLLRTHYERRPPRAVSAVLLAPRHAAHRALLKNLVAWCAAGPPSAVVVDAPAGPPAPIIHRKLRLQGVRAVVHPVADETGLDFREWPLWGARDALLPEAWDPTSAADWPENDPHAVKPWLRRGHRIVVVEREDSLTIRHGESDAHWVASRWATWYRLVPTAAWHGGKAGSEDMKGSIVATRSILRTLAALGGTARGAPLPGLAHAHAVLDELTAAGTGVDAEALGLPDPEVFTEPVTALLRSRIGDSDNVDETVSATVAALDVDALLSKAPLSGGLRDRLEAWLLRTCPSAALEDRLEIARCLGDDKLLERVIAGAGGDVRVGQPASAVLITNLRSALVTCGLGPDVELKPLALDPDHAVVERELRMRPMLAAGYLIGVLDLQWKWDPEKVPEPTGVAKVLRDPPDTRLDSAVITLGRHGPLSKGARDWAAPVPELASTEALALIAYFARHRVPTHVVSGADPLPPGTLSSLLREAEKIRAENARLDAELTRSLDTAARGGLTLALAGEGLILLLAVLFGLVVGSSGDVVWLVPGVFVLWTMLALLWLYLLGRYDLRVRGAARIAPWLAGGWSAVRKDLAKAIEDESAGEGRDRIDPDAGPPRGAAS